MIRVGFIFTFNDQSWLGGINYYRNLVKAVQSVSRRHIEPVILTGSRAKEELLKGFGSAEIITTSMLDMYAPLWAIRQIVKKSFSHDFFLERLLKRHSIDVLSHCFGSLGAGAKIPTIGWIPDFQHVRMPGFFSNKEISLRDRMFRDICTRCDRVILSSRDAQNDLTFFSPACMSKSSVLHFVSLPEASDIPDLATLEKKYEFKGQYFFVPNQFWKHKNHRVIVDALHILKSTGRRVLVLATGNMRDHRQTDFFDSLMIYAGEAGVRDCFKVLGVIPYGDIVALMDNAVAVINPSLFEGWSTTVEESKSLGKRIILSDIPVHREQAPPGGVYFDPEDFNALAEVIWTIWSDRSPEADMRLADEAEKKLPARLTEFVSAYEFIVTETLRESSQTGV